MLSNTFYVSSLSGFTDELSLYSQRPVVWYPKVFCPFLYVIVRRPSVVVCKCLEDGDPFLCLSGLHLQKAEQVPNN